MDAQEISISIGPYQIAAKQWGNPDGHPTLALHGWLDNCASFNFLAPFLHDHNVIALDLLGHGQSSHLSDYSIYHFTDATVHLQQIIEQLNWDKVNLIGHSMGGAISCLYATIAPRQIKKMIILEGLGPLSEDETPANEQLKTYIKKRSRMSSYIRRDYAAVEEAAKVRADKGYINFESALELARRGTRKTDSGITWSHDPRLLLPSPIKLRETQVLDFLHAIQAPLCFIRGADGFSYDESKMQGRTQAVTYLTEHTVPGGHHMHMEYPEETARIINAFFDED